MYGSRSTTTCRWSRRRRAARPGPRQRRRERRCGTPPAGARSSSRPARRATGSQIRVVDRGPGVPDEAKDRIFAPFQRLGDAPRGDGVGLGLAVARGLTEAMDGTLWPRTPPAAGSPWSSTSPTVPAAVDPALRQDPPRDLRPRRRRRAAHPADPGDQPAGARLRGRDRRRRPLRAADRSPSAPRTSSSSTSGCRTSTASSAPPAARRVRRCRSSCSPRGTTPTTRSRPSTPAPTTTSPSRSGWTSSWPGSGPPCAAGHPRTPTAASSTTDDFTLDFAERRRHRGRHRDPAHADRVAPARGLAAARGPPRHAYRAAPRRLGTRVRTRAELPPGVCQPAAPQARTRPAAPRYLLTEPGIGYRFVV